MDSLASNTEKLPKHPLMTEDLSSLNFSKKTPPQSQGSSKAFELPRLVEFDPAASYDRKNRKKRTIPKVRLFGLIFNKI